MSYIKNKGLELTYICSRNNRVVYAGNPVLSSLLYYSILYLVIGLILSLLLSRIIYNPLRQLKTYIAHHPVSISAELSPENNDFDYLSHAYRKIMDINTDLQQINHAYLKERYKKLMNALLTDTSGDFTQYSAELEALNASQHEKNNLILLLLPDSLAEQSELHMESQLLKYAIQNVAQELLSATVSVQHIDMESPFVVFLLNFQEPNIDDIVQCIKEAQAFILKYYKTTFSVGIGEPVEELTELAISYSGAYEALSRRFVSGKGSIHNAADLNLSPVPEQVYPFEISDSLLNAVRSLSLENASGYVHDFIRAVRTYDIEHILCFILQLSSSLQRLEHTNYITVEGIWNYSALEQSTLDAIEAKLLARCRYDIGELSKSKKADSGQKELMDEIVHLVADNIYNPNLSVAFLADKVHLSVNYLRNIFKENTGDSLSAYITQKRLDLICDLLLNTDMPLSEISDKLGFSTKNYFFTFVKKHTGMTPGDYRKKMK